MAHSPCTEPAQGRLDQDQADALLSIARAAIRHGLENDRPLAVDLASLPQALTRTTGSFVAVYCSGQLRGCVGKLTGSESLGEDVAVNAHHAAFADPRFEALSRIELLATEIEINVLTVPMPVHIRSEADLLRQLVPGIDGLVLIEGDRHATFLPKVWEQLPDAGEFLAALKAKAGLAADHWSRELRFARYQASTCRQRF